MSKLLNQYLFVLALALYTGLQVGCNVQINGNFNGYSFDYTGQKLDKSDTGTFDDGVVQIQVANKFGDITVLLLTGCGLQDSTLDLYKTDNGNKTADSQHCYLQKFRYCYSENIHYQNQRQKKYLIVRGEDSTLLL